MLDRSYKLAARGTAMVETVSVLGFVLALLFGSAQIVLMGFYQLQLDAATFLYSHSYALSANSSINISKLQPAVPVAIPNGTIKTTPAPPPNTSVADPNGLAVLGELTSGGVEGGVNDPGAERFGGASIILPQQVVTIGTLNLTSFDTSLFTSNHIVLTAGNVEGQPMVAAHDDDSQDYDYGDPAAPGNVLKNPYLAYGNGGDDQDVPPYYFGMAYMNECQYTPPTNTVDCVANQPLLNALGLAEFLKADSNPAAANGNYTIDADGIGIGQLFGAMTFHEQVYAEMAQLLVSQYGSYAAATTASATGTNAFTTCEQSLENWDVQEYTYPGVNDLGTQDPQTPLAAVSSLC